MPLFGRGDQPVDPLASIRSKFKEIPSQFANQYKLGEDDTPESAKAKLFAAGRAHALAEQQKAQQTGTGKYGRGSLDDIRASLGVIDMSNIPSYNIINDDDSLDVAKAKAEKIRQIDAETQQRIMSPQTPTIDSTSVQTTTKESTPVQQPVQQVNVPDNGDKLDKMIDLLTTMNGALLTIASALTGGGNSANTDVAKNVQNTMAELTKAGGGLSDSLAGQGTNGILSTLLGITSR